jgi:HNH endonuclease
MLTFDDVNTALRLEGPMLVWRVTRGKAKAGAIAGSLDQDGYRKVQLLGHNLLAHRIVWFLTYGEWPAGMLDHINGRRDDNAPSNLRLATQSQNSRNRKSVGAIDFKGVTPHKQSGRFQAQCGRKYLGLFAKAADAAKAYDAEAARLYGQFARLNFGRLA